ncbi:extracellular solute-binding protein family 3 [Parafrankia sp. EAN1pec]|uniref:glutamate ABC transporter substrate-binding protein n=1 Tax=Parafrankia sp. (strain EAN1pec) TaxID=298653 RepID=UPI0000544FAA|nr:extracellular solute-binding protein family 3 [Frankia sp. EAN1pec]
MRRAALVAAALMTAAALVGCSTVSGDLPRAADQPWEPLVTASGEAADAAQDARPEAAVPTNLVLPTDAGDFASGGSLDKIRKRGFLRVGVSRDTQTRGAWSPVSHRFEGFDVELAQRIAEALFGPGTADEKVRYRPVSYAERLPAVENGEVDILVSTLTYSESRAERVGLSAAYFTAHPRLLSHRESTHSGAGPGIDSPEELAGKRVCAPRGTTTLTNLENTHQTHPTFEIVDHLNELSDCLVAFQQGEVDVVAANDASLVGMLEQDATAVLGTFSVGRDEYYSVAFERDDTELAGFVNGVLERLRRDKPEWLKLCERWKAPEMPCEESLPPEPQWAR